MMSYKDIKEALAKRAAKENTKSKRKSGQKRKVVAVKKDDFEPDMELETVQRIKVPQLERTPVARMY